MQSIHRCTQRRSINSALFPKCTHHWVFLLLKHHFNNLLPWAVTSSGSLLLLDKTVQIPEMDIQILLKTLWLIFPIFSSIGTFQFNQFSLSRQQNTYVPSLSSCSCHFLYPLLWIFHENPAYSLRFHLCSTSFHVSFLVHFNPDGSLHSNVLILILCRRPFGNSSL